ncbi:hypothetical protein M8C21_029393, partial [Ambrosia artemisiifolia]
ALGLQQHNWEGDGGHKVDNTHDLSETRDQQKTRRLKFPWRGYHTIVLAYGQGQYNVDADFVDAQDNCYADLVNLKEKTVTHYAIAMRGCYYSPFGYELEALDEYYLLSHSQ